jgi:hypothetical protein
MISARVLIYSCAVEGVSSVFSQTEDDFNARLTIGLHGMTVMPL